MALAFCGVTPCVASAKRKLRSRIPRRPRSTSRVAGEPEMTRDGWRTMSELIAKKVSEYRKNLGLAVIDT